MVYLLFSFRFLLFSYFDDNSGTYLLIICSRIDTRGCESVTKEVP